MARKEGSLKLSSNIEPRASAPLDARTIVPTLADLTVSGAFPYPYVGMIVSVQSEGKAYMLTASDTTVAANWKEIGSGNSIQVEELPDPTIAEVGVIYQYVGETTSEYVNGYFYVLIDKIIASNVFVENEADANGLFSSEYFTSEDHSTLEGDLLRRDYTPKPGYIANIVITISGSDTPENNFRYASINYDLERLTIATSEDTYFYTDFGESYCTLSIKGWYRIDVQPSLKEWTGTHDEWDNLTSAEKAVYDGCKINFTDDDDPNDIKQWFADQLELSDYEVFHLSTTPTTAQYDGELLWDWNTESSGHRALSINSTIVAHIGEYDIDSPTTLTCAIKKGDSLAIDSSEWGTIRARWYKKRDYSLRN